MNTNKQITLITDSLRGGGAQRVCVNIANGLIKLGWNVDLVVLNLNDAAYLNQVSKKINLIELNTNRVLYSCLPLLKYIYQKKPNLFLVFNYELTVMLILLRNLLKFKFKIITRNISTLSQKQEELKQQNFWAKNIVGSLISSFYHKADHIINQCYSMQKDLIKLYPKLKNTTSVIYNPVANHIIDYISSNDLNKIKKKDYLLCVGSLKKPKAFHYAIEGFSEIVNEFPTLRLKIVGQGSLKQELEKGAEDCGVRNSVDFEGFQKDIIPYYLYARATVLTSLYEGFPNVLIESITLGTPVVSFDCPSGPSEIIIGGKNGYLVSYKDLNDLKKKLSTVMLNKFDIKKMGFTVNRYRPNEIMKYYEKLLNSFI